MEETVLYVNIDDQEVRCSYVDGYITVELGAMEAILNAAGFRRVTT